MQNKVEKQMSVSTNVIFLKIIKYRFIYIFYHVSPQFENSNDMKKNGQLTT